MKKFSSAEQSKAIANFIQNLSDVGSKEGSKEDLDDTDEGDYLFFFVFSPILSFFIQNFGNKKQLTAWFSSLSYFLLLFFIIDSYFDEKENTPRYQIAYQEIGRHCSL